MSLRSTVSNAQEKDTSSNGIEIFIPFDVLLAVTITSLLCVCFMCCMGLIFYCYHKKAKTVEEDITTPIADTVDAKSLIMAHDAANNQTKFNFSHKNKFDYHSPATNAFVTASGKRNIPLKPGRNVHPHPPQVSTITKSPKELEIRVENIETIENTVLSPLSTDLDIVFDGVQQNAGSEETIITESNGESDRKRDDHDEKKGSEKHSTSTTPTPTATKTITTTTTKHAHKLSDDSLDRFNKLNDTVVKLNAHEMFKRMTSKGTIVLQHRRATQRHFKANESIPMNEVILPYDSKHGIRRFESVPGLRMTSIPLSDMSELHEHRTSILSVSRGIKSIEIDEEDQEESIDDQPGRKKVPKCVNVTIIPGCKWIEKKKGEKSGRLVLPQDFNNYELAIDYATKSKLGYYGVKFVLESDNTRIKLPFDSTIAEYQYSQDYLNKYILKNGTGIEMHAFPHFDRPLSENNGFFIFGKRVNMDVSNTFDLHLTAFKIPKKCFVYVPPFVIHSNDYFLGKWTTLLSWDQDIDHVVIDDSNVKEKTKDVFRWQFVESRDKTSPFYKQIAV